MPQFQIHFPQLCAWCGARQPEGNRRVEVSSTTGNRRVRMQFEAPVCSTCGKYATALKKAASRREIWTLIGCLAVALPPILLLLSGEPWVIKLIIWPIAGFMLFIVATILVQATKLDKRMNERAVGPAPEGYASTTHSPCKVVGGSKLKFYNDTFHQQFAAGNPNLVQ